MRIFLVLLISAFILISCRTKPQITDDPQVIIQEIAIDFIEPEFEIVSIYIIQADLVVTEFEAVLKITNPNDFDVELSSISYELFGRGELWADGIQANILQIPAQSSEETRFSFSMNFIDNSRRLLDDVIAMRMVNYNFRGQALIHSIAEEISVDFDCSGLSEIKRRAW